MEGWFSWRGVLCLFISLNWFSLVVEEDFIYVYIYNIYIYVNAYGNKNRENMF